MNSLGGYLVHHTESLALSTNRQGYGRMATLHKQICRIIQGKDLLYVGRRREAILFDWPFCGKVLKKSSYSYSGMTCLKIKSDFVHKSVAL